MPNRLIREGILTSERVNTIADDPLTEVFFRRLMSVADDFGRYHGHPSLLRAALYPLRLARVSDEDMLLHLNRCEVAGLVVLYESGGKPFIEIANFSQRTRAKCSKFPAPDGQTAVTCQAPDSHLTDNCPTDDGHMSGRRQTHDGHMRTETKTYSNTNTETAASVFLESYPRRTGLQIGLQTYQSITEPGEHAEVMAGLERWKLSEAWSKDGGRYIPEPGRWLTDRRWREYPLPAQASGTYETPIFKESF